MPALDQDDALLKLPNLCSVHIDAIRCIYDERINRVKDLKDSPATQFVYLKEISDDAFKFWESVSDRPEGRPDVRQDFKVAIFNFFNRVIRYAKHHEVDNLTPEQAQQQTDLIADLEKKIDKLDPAP